MMWLMLSFYAEKTGVEGAFMPSVNLLRSFVCGLGFMCISANKYREREFKIHHRDLLFLQPERKIPCKGADMQGDS